MVKCPKSHGQKPLRHRPWTDGAMTPFPHSLKGTVKQMAIPDGGKGKSKYGTMGMSSNPFFRHILYSDLATCHSAHAQLILMTGGKRVACSQK